jgi:dUTP pyrophosphatase
MKSVQIHVLRCPGTEDIPLPEYQTSGSSGLDLHAVVSEPVSLEPGQVRLIPTGIRLAIPAGFEGQVRPRSGLALRHSIGLVNSPGTIDSDYRGEVGVLLINFGKEPFLIRRGDRIAQLVVARVEKIVFVETSELASSRRNEGGFGSTGQRKGKK